MNPALICAASLLALSAQTAAPPPTEPPEPVPDSIAIGSDANRMTVPVEIADAGPFPFVIDTGAERTVISRELAATLGLAAGPSVRVTAMANVAQVATVVIPRLRVGANGSLHGSRIEAPTFASVDLGAAGMLGIDTLHGHKVTIDFDRRAMAVTPSTKHRREPPAEPGEVIVRARDMFGQLVVTDAYIGARRVRVVIDTGSDVTMGNLALRRLLARRKLGFESIALRAVTGVWLNADYTQIGAVRIGSTTIDNLPVAFADAPPFARFGLADKPALMLGMDALRLFRRVTIDFPNRELRLLLPRDVRMVPAAGLGRA